MRRGGLIIISLFFLAALTLTSSVNGGSSGVKEEVKKAVKEIKEGFQDVGEGVKEGLRDNDK